jgi:hypothetical protein
MAFLAAFAAAFIFVFLKSWQQQNVVYQKYLWILPTSMAMAFCEGFVVWQLATAFKIILVVIIGFGSGLGCLLATYLHHKFLAQ